MLMLEIAGGILIAVAVLLVLFMILGAAASSSGGGRSLTEEESQKLWEATVRDTEKWAAEQHRIHVRWHGRWWSGRDVDHCADCAREAREEKGEATIHGDKSPMVVQDSEASSGSLRGLRRRVG